MADKTFVTPQSLLDDSFRLGLKIMEDGFHPDYIIGIWRGGTPVGNSLEVSPTPADLAHRRVPQRKACENPCRERR